MHRWDRNRERVCLGMRDEEESEWGQVGGFTASVWPALTPSMLWENSIFPNKNSSQVQAKHSLQPHFHLLKIARAHTHTSDTHRLFNLSTGAQRRTVSPGAGRKTLNSDESSDIAARPCFQTDHVTHQKIRTGKREWREESRRDRGWRDGEKKMKVYSQSS